MRRFMRKAEGLAVAALALVGAGQVVVWMNQAIQYALVAYGQWEAAEAAKAAPLILFSLAFGLALSLCMGCMRTTSGTPAAALMGA